MCSILEEHYNYVLHFNRRGALSELQIHRQVAYYERHLFILRQDYLEI